MIDRGQSTTIGFVVVFATVLVMVALVSVSGYSALQDVRDVERVDNGVRSFEVLSSNVDDVVSGGVPSRTTTVKLAGARLSTADPVTFEVHVPADGFRREVEVRPLVFDADTGTQVVYSNGAVIRANRDGQVVASGPKPLVSAEYAVISFVRTRPAESSVGGHTSVSVRTTRNGTTVSRVDTAGDDVYLNVTTSRSEAWARYLDGQPNIDCTRSGDTVTCTLTTDATTVSVTDVDVRLDG